MEGVDRRKSRLDENHLRNNKETNVNYFVEQKRTRYEPSPRGIRDRIDTPRKGPIEQQRNFSNPVRQSQIKRIEIFDIVTTKPELKEVYLKPDVVNCNKKMFATALLGHLGLAKKKLEEDSEKIQIQADRMQAATQKNAEESLKILQQRNEMDREEKRERESMIRQRQLNKKLADIDRHTNNWKESLLASKDSIVTTVEPKIAWKPVHHNEITYQLLELREKEIEKLIQERDEIDTSHKNELIAKCNLANGNDTYNTSADELELNNSFDNPTDQNGNGDVDNNDDIVVSEPITCSKDVDTAVEEDENIKTN